MSNLPADLPKRLRKYGLKVVEVPGWQTRGRTTDSTHGAFAPVGVLCHDTVTSKATSDAAVVKLLVDGRSDLPGPLAQLGLARDGTVHIIAAGRSNHAGVAKPCGTVAGGDGNELYIGIEAFNAGTGEPWLKPQYDAYVLLAAALCIEVTGNSFRTVNGHKETSTEGKIDPSGPTPYESTFDMDKFRARVAAKIKALQNPPKPTPVPLGALDGWFYNLRVGRDQAQVSDEVHAMLATEPAFLGLCEAVGYTLPQVRGYTLIRDRSSQSRADIALYVKNTLGVSRSWWRDLKKTWPEVKHSGTHAARSLLVVKLGNGWRLVVGQVPQKPLSKFPPKTNTALIAARGECADALKSLIAPSKLTHPLASRRPTLAILDWNGISGQVAKAITGTAADPTHIDNAVGRRVVFSGVHYPRTVGGVELKSDHKHALRFVVTELS